MRHAAFGSRVRRGCFRRQRWGWHGRRMQRSLFRRRRTGGCLPFVVASAQQKECREQQEDTGFHHTYGAFVAAKVRHNVRVRLRKSVKIYIPSRSLSKR